MPSKVLPSLITQIVSLRNNAYLNDHSNKMFYIIKFISLYLFVDFTVF